MAKKNDNITEESRNSVIEEEVLENKPKVYTEKELNEEVEIELFKDNDRYKDDVDVGCNGVICRIPRGVPVKVKRKFALILKQSMEQDKATAELISGLISKGSEQ